MARWRQVAAVIGAESQARVYCLDAGDDREGWMGVRHRDGSPELWGPVYLPHHDGEGDRVEGVTVIDRNPVLA